MSLKSEHTGIGQSFCILRQSWSQGYLLELRCSLPTSMLQGCNHPWFSSLLVSPIFEAPHKGSHVCHKLKFECFVQWVLKLTSKYSIRWHELRPKGPTYISSPPRFIRNSCGSSRMIYERCFPEFKITTESSQFHDCHNLPHQKLQKCQCWAGGLCRQLSFLCPPYYGLPSSQLQLPWHLVLKLVRPWKWWMGWQQAPQQ